MIEMDLIKRIQATKIYKCMQYKIWWNMNLHWTRGNGNPAFALNAGNWEGQANVFWPAKMLFGNLQDLKVFTDPTLSGCQNLWHLTFKKRRNIPCISSYRWISCFLWLDYNGQCKISPVYFHMRRAGFDGTVGAC